MAREAVRTSNGDDLTLRQMAEADDASRRIFGGHCVQEELRVVEVVCSNTADSLSVTHLCEKVSDVWQSPV